MEKRLYSAAEVSKDTPAAFYLKAFDRNDLLERLAVIYACADTDNLPKQELVERWLRMLSAKQLKELADKIAGQLMQLDEFNDDVTDAIDDTLLDVVTKNSAEIYTRRPDGMVGYLFPWSKANDNIGAEELRKAGFSPDAPDVDRPGADGWKLSLFIDTPVGRLVYCRISLDIEGPFVGSPLHQVSVDFEHPAASFRKRFDNKIIGPRLKQAAHGVFWSKARDTVSEAFNDVSDRFMQKREEILGIIREISPEEFV